MLKKKYLSPNMDVYITSDDICMDAISASGTTNIFDIWE